MPIRVVSDGETEVISPSVMLLVRADAAVASDSTGDEDRSAPDGTRDDATAGVIAGATIEAPVAVIVVEGAEADCSATEGRDALLAVPLVMPLVVPLAMLVTKPPLKVPAAITSPDRVVPEIG